MHTPDEINNLPQFKQFLADIKELNKLLKETHTNTQLTDENYKKLSDCKEKIIKQSREVYRELKIPEQIIELITPNKNKNKKEYLFNNYDIQQKSYKVIEELEAEIEKCYHSLESDITSPQQRASFNTTIINNKDTIAKIKKSFDGLKEMSWQMNTINESIEKIKDAKPKYKSERWENGYSFVVALSTSFAGPVAACSVLGGILGACIAAGVGAVPGLIVGAKVGAAIGTAFGMGLLLPVWNDVKSSMNPVFKEKHSAMSAISELIKNVDALIEINNNPKEHLPTLPSRPKS